MTADLLPEDAPDAEELVVCWLADLLRAAVVRRTGDPLPFCQVSRVAGADDSSTGVDDPVVQLDIFADGVAAAATTAKEVHRRMTLLGRTAADVTLTSGAKANCDYVDCTLKPFRMAYEDDQIVRYTARYTLGLSYVAV